VGEVDGRFGVAVVDEERRVRDPEDPAPSEERSALTVRAAQAAVIRPR
jgi:hypothetical protein